jgi:hypothetical protein
LRETGSRCEDPGYVIFVVDSLGPASEKRSCALPQVEATIQLAYGADSARKVLPGLLCSYFLISFYLWVISLVFAGHVEVFLFSCTPPFFVPFLSQRSASLCAASSVDRRKPVIGWAASSIYLRRGISASSFC